VWLYKRYCRVLLGGILLGVAHWSWADAYDAHLTQTVTTTDARTSRQLNYLALESPARIADRQYDYLQLSRVEGRILFDNPTLLKLDQVNLNTSNLPSPGEPSAPEGFRLIQLPMVDVRYSYWHGHSASKMGKIGKNLRILRTKALDDPQHNGYPNIYLGGEFETSLQYSHNRPTTMVDVASTDGNRFLFNTGTLFAIGNINNWLTADFAYSFVTESAENMMLIVGDLRASPFFFSGGRQFGQFGIFPNYPVGLIQLPREIFRINTVTTNLGYASEFFDTQVGVLANRDTSDFNAVSADVMLRLPVMDNLGFEIGGSVISNMLDKTAIFSDPVFTQSANRLPAVDINAGMVWGEWDVQLEFSQVLRSSNEFDRIGTVGIQTRYLLPDATTLVPTYMLAGYSQIINGEKVFTNPAYDSKRLPKKRVNAGIFMNLFDYTQLGIEYGYGRNYFAKNIHLVQIVLNLQI
jgi:hypothetical protein